MTEQDAIERIVLTMEAQTLALESIQRLLYQMLEVQKEATDGVRAVTP